ncbi:MAG: hypothetical protein LBH43_01615 [Treponema sp.]|jgi:hypothetical protein|nr:hypothetical protein [Treponema sp.]
MDFYGRVKKLAKEHNYPTLLDFILSTGLNQDSYYSMKRAGNLPRADEALEIAKALNTTIEYLITGEGQTASESDKALDEIEDIINKYRKRGKK